MYSLYRAWLMRDALSLAPPPCAPLTTTGPSPATPPLAGAPNVVIQVGPTLTQFSAHKAVISAHSGYFKAALATENGSPISIPNINVDEFSSLLTFMYTGYLDLNLNNIYNILLATHVLHMPRALEMCRDFLIRNHPLDPHPNIIKPIPSRKLPIQPQFYPPIISSLQSSDSTPFKPIGELRSEVKNREDEQVASTSRQTPSPFVNPCDDSQDEPISKKYEEKQREKISRKRSENRDEKVIIDIACCDGPVRFHRVINKCYGLTDVEIEPKIINSNEAMNKLMNVNIRDKKLSDENSQNSQNESFTCIYCNHTFKSQYCYQKHARRHINPVTMEVKNSCVNEPTNSTSSNKREVKLLDMNVQYYPCKTCGSKFPSYYFVHKHRKMCHSDEMERNEEKSPVNEEKSNQ